MPQFWILVLTSVVMVLQTTEGWSCALDIISCFDCSLADIKTLSEVAPDCPGATLINLNKNKFTSVQFPRRFIQKYANASLWIADNSISSLNGLSAWHGPGLLLDKNLFTSLDPKYIGEHLEYLSVDHNSLPILDLSAGTRLQVVYAKSTSLEDIKLPDPCIIFDLFFGDNNLNHITPSILKCTRLKHFYIEKNLLFEMPDSLIRLLMLRKTEWANGDSYEEISVDLTENKIPEDNVIEAFKRFHKEEKNISIFESANCRCAVVRTRDRVYASVKYCISSMCSARGEKKWHKILE